MQYWGPGIAHWIPPLVRHVTLLWKSLHEFLSSWSTFWHCSQPAGFGWCRSVQLTQPSAHSFSFAALRHQYSLVGAKAEEWSPGREKISPGATPNCVIISVKCLPCKYWPLIGFLPTSTPSKPAVLTCPVDIASWTALPTWTVPPSWTAAPGCGMPGN